eukprot:TRINITY_DN11573_c0_g1_i1.p1 TRINITY_DN11573_c0_g1~~TRINITY_DN11573_c0_g1_i1.p1  ORF type:complete len:469 (+),score=53.73 TRINITY_DN11573_c0_g1_i1:52-1458(+)
MNAPPVEESDDEIRSNCTEEELEGRLNMVPFPPQISEGGFFCVKGIVFTGGPNGGKTTALSQCAERLRSMGLQVFVLPDTGSSMATAGVGFASCTAEAQKVIWVKNKLKMEMATESAFIRIAIASCKSSVILFDRGTLDTALFCTPETWKQILADMDLKESDLLARYDTVVHLTTTAMGAELAYDSYREEEGIPREDAIELDEKLKKVWEAHPSHKVIDNTAGGMEEKIQHAMSEICHFLGVRSPMLYKQQFLVDLELIRMVRDCDWVHNFLEEFEVEITFLEGSTSMSNTFVRRIRRNKPGSSDSFAQCTKQVAPITPKTPLCLPSCPSPPTPQALLSPDLRSPSFCSSTSSTHHSPTAQLLPHTPPQGHISPQTTLRSTESIITKREYEHLLSTQAMADGRTLLIKRRCFCYRMQWCQLDYCKQAGIIILEVETATPNSEVLFPKWYVEFRWKKKIFFSSPGWSNM